jgi:hypothetical protein
LACFRCEKTVFGGFLNAVNTNLFLQLLESRPSFQNTNSPDEMIIEGWQKKFELPGRMVQPTAAA